MQKLKSYIQSLITSKLRKTINLLKIAVFIALLKFSFAANAQTACPENIYLHTNRDFYISGETLYFKAYYIISDSSLRKSRIFYVELLGLNKKTAIVKGVFEMAGNTAQGSVFLPDSLKSGHYQLIAYTNRMRNCVNTQLLRHELIIVNRFGHSSEEFLQFAALENDTARIAESTPIAGNRQLGRNELPELIISTNKNEFAKRELIEVSLKINHVANRTETGNFSVSVQQVLELSSAAENHSLENGFQIDPNKVADEYSGKNEDRLSKNYPVQPARTVFPAETEGHIVSGRVKDIQTGEPVAGALVYFSFIDTVAWLNYDITNDSGYFYFLFPVGVHINPAVVQVWNSPNDYKNCFIEPVPEFGFISSGTRVFSDTTAEYMNKRYGDQVKAFGLNASFRPVSVSSIALMTSDALLPNYSGLQTSVFPSGFIRLNNFSEIAKEILPGVRFRDDGQGYSLRIMNELQNSYFDNDPLVLINGFPVKDYNYLAVLTSDDIEQIDIVQRYFVVGRQVFHGLLSVKLKKNNYLELVQGSHIYVVENRVNNQKFIFDFPEYDTLAAKQSRKPDFRNTLYWNPEVSLDKDLQRLSFFSSDMSGTYKIVIEGMLDGKYLVSGTRYIRVTESY